MLSVVKRYQSLERISLVFLENIGMKWRRVPLIFLDSIENMGEKTLDLVVLGRTMHMTTFGSQVCKVSYTIHRRFHYSSALSEHAEPEVFSLLDFPCKSLCLSLWQHYPLCDCFLLPSRTKSWSGVNHFTNNRHIESKKATICAA